jgi:cation diffusion facilitator family transporter
LTTPTPTKQLYRQATQASLLGLVVNLGLGLLKLAGGIFGNSFALVSDAIHSLGDSVTSVVVLGALHYAQRPSNKEHPYGYARAEAVAGANVAVLILVSGCLIGWEALKRLGLPHEVPALWTLGIAGINVVLKEGLFRYKAYIGQKTGSSALIANAWDHRTDALCSLAVLVGLGLERWGGPFFSWADEAAALVIVAVILWTGLGLLRNSARELLDVQADEQWLKQIRQTAGEVPGVRGVEKLWVRKSGLEYFADIHIEVDENLTVADGHRIGHLVKARLMQTYPVLRDVLVHVEPYPQKRTSPD